MYRAVLRCLLRGGSCIDDRLCTSSAIHRLDSAIHRPDSEIHRPDSAIHRLDDVSLRCLMRWLLTALRSVVAYVLQPSVLCELRNLKDLLFLSPLILVNNILSGVMSIIAFYVAFYVAFLCTTAVPVQILYCTDTTVL